MRVMQNVSATAEQLLILRHDKPGTLIIRGAAGSGKTTTALLRLKVVTEFFREEFAKSGGKTLNVLVLTFNRTLAGYVEALANQKVKAGAAGAPVNLTVDTFAGWAMDVLGNPKVAQEACEARIKDLGSKLGLPDRFLSNEVSYVLGRFLPEDINDYLTIKREGRGLSPQMPSKMRQRLLDEVIAPYTAWKAAEGLQDWNDLAVTLAKKKLKTPYDIVVIDETQDFHANRIRAIRNQLAPDYSLTFVLDSAQRIYPHFFKWNEVGVTATSGNVRALSKNYRNTKEIAEFAAPLVDGIDIGQDGTMPDFASCTETGPKPVVLRGLYRNQVDWAINYIKKSVKLTEESVVFVHPKGWFTYLRSQLASAKLPFEDLTRERDWPVSDTNIGLSTMHSAKGLEFDHVICLGLSAEATPHGNDPGDVDLEDLRRLLAMAVGRAKRSVVIGYKPSEASDLIKFFKPGTFTAKDI